MEFLPISTDFETTLARRRPHRIGPLPWAFLDQFRSTATAKPEDRPTFSGTWPSLTRMLEITAWRFPDRPCLTIFENNTRISLSFRETLNRSQILAAFFRSKGLKPGDRIAVCGKNSPEWAIAYLGALFADAIIVPLDVTLKQSELQTLLEVSGSTIFLADADKLEGIARGNQAIHTIVSLEPGDNYIYDKIATSADLPRAPSPERNQHDTAAILYTSGTTGNPKGVQLSHENLVADTYLSQYHMVLFPTDVFYALLPIHHSYTMQAVFIESLAVGCEIIFGKKMVIAQILKDLKQGKVTMFLGVPMLFNRLLAGILKGVREKGPLVFGIIRFLMWVSGVIKKTTGINPGKQIFNSLLARASLDNIRICISGGGPLPKETFQRFNELGIDFVQGYGLTETSPIVTLNPIWHYKEASVGAIIPGVEMKVLSPDQTGQGEIAIRGPVVMKGYYGATTSGGLELEPDGWLHTGDVGWIDAEGYVYLTGRAKNVIVTEGGKNVYPEEIENNFQLYPEIDQIMIRGFLLDPKTKAEGIEAMIYPAQDSFSDPDGKVDKTKMFGRIQEIINEINTKLASHQKINRHSILDKAMEMTSSRKIRRFTVENDK